MHALTTAAEEEKSSTALLICSNQHLSHHKPVFCTSYCTDWSHMQTPAPVKRKWGTEEEDVTFRDTQIRRAGRGACDWGCSLLLDFSLLLFVFCFHPKCLLIVNLNKFASLMKRELITLSHDPSVCRSLPSLQAFNQHLTSPTGPQQQAVMLYSAVKTH